MEEFDACVTRIKPLQNLEVSQDAYINQILTQSRYKNNIKEKLCV